MAEPPQEDIRLRIQNTIAILEAEAAKVEAAARRDLQLAVETLLAARTALDERDEELDLVTAPDRNAAEEAQRIARELEGARERIVALEQQLAEKETALDIEEQVHEEERRRLKKLEKQAASFESILETDQQAFSKFMDKALEEEERKRRKR